MRKNEHTEHNKKEYLEALEKSLGVKTTACKVTGIGRTTVYDWIKDDQEFRNAVKEIEQVALDFVESKLFEQIRGNNTSSTIFYLKTKGKNRGYIERQEITGAEGERLFQVKIIDEGSYDE
jgi:hypothetical protein